MNSSGAVRISELVLQNLNMFSLQYEANLVTGKASDPA